YSSDSLHSAVVEIIVKKGARCRYTTIQNWSNPSPTRADHGAALHLLPLAYPPLVLIQAPSV
ncbi:Fe-S cluster assembly protein SufB, partial [Streptomyces fradiae]